MNENNKGRKFNKNDKTEVINPELNFLELSLNKIKLDLKNAHTFVSNLNRHKKIIENLIKLVK